MGWYYRTAPLLFQEKKIGFAGQEGRTFGLNWGEERIWHDMSEM